MVEASKFHRTIQGLLPGDILYTLISVDLLNFWQGS